MTMGQLLPDREHLKDMRRQGWTLEGMGDYYGVPAYTIWAVMTSQVTDEDLRALLAAESGS